MNTGVIAPSGTATPPDLRYWWGTKAKSATTRSQRLCDLHPVGLRRESDEKRPLEAEIKGISRFLFLEERASFLPGFSYII